MNAPLPPPYSRPPPPSSRPLPPSSRPPLRRRALNVGMWWARTSRWTATTNCRQAGTADAPSMGVSTVRRTPPTCTASWLASTLWRQCRMLVPQPKCHIYRGCKESNATPIFDRPKKQKKNTKKNNGLWLNMYILREVYFVEKNAKK